MALVHQDHTVPVISADPPTEGELKENEALIKVHCLLAISACFSVALQETQAMHDACEDLRSACACIHGRTQQATLIIQSPR
jgi:hypothetical protein